MSDYILSLAHEHETGPNYSGRIASEQRDGPGYNTAPPPTRDESVLTCGFKVMPGTAYGFFTDTTVCIGCKACEAACKQWNQLPMDHFGWKGHSYDNTGELRATTWRHVAFIEEFGIRGQGFGDRGQGADGRGAGGSLSPWERVGMRAGLRTRNPEPRTQNWEPSPAPRAPTSRGRWLFMSDVCKHCENAGCLEACPTGAIVRTEFGSVLIQQDICNGCKYCVTSCPFGVITVAEDKNGMANKCTLCYDRLKEGLEPACAKACPTDSILFGPVEELRRIAYRRVAELHDQGYRDAYLYGVPDSMGATGGIGSLNCFFLLTERPEAYNLPATPELPSTRVIKSSLAAAATALAYGVATAWVIYRARNRG